MTSITTYIDEADGIIYLETHEHAGDHDACIVVSALCNVLIGECEARGRPFTADDTHILISIQGAEPSEIAVYRAVFRELKVAGARLPAFIEVS